MAELTPTKRTGAYSAGYKAQEVAELPAVSDGDTFVSELPNVEYAIPSFIDDAAVAADSIAIASISGATVTFQVAGTARKATVLVVGF